MSIVILTKADVEHLLPMDACIDVMAAALRALSAGQAMMPLRQMLWLPERVGVLGAMPAYIVNPPTLGLKLITVFPGNEQGSYETHQGAVLLVDPQHGNLVSMIDAGAITAIRTAAVSGMATRVLAREDARDLAILGSGVQAASHLRAMLAARPLRHVRVWSRRHDRARAFATTQSQRHGVSIEPVGSVAEAVRGVDIICTTTAAQEPILHGGELPLGVHINAVGSGFAFARELDGEAIRRSRLIVDSREAALAEAGDFLLARDEGVVGDAHIAAEIGEVLLGRVPGRRAHDEITLFKAVGLAVEDAAAASHVFSQAQAGGVGTRVEFG